MAATLHAIFTQFNQGGENQKELEQQLIAFKKSDCWDICAEVLSDVDISNALPTKLFCASCCSSFVENYWISLNLDRKNTIRSFLWNFVRNRVSGQNSVAAPLFSMIVKVLVEIVERDWPDIDSSLFTNLFELISISCPSFTNPSESVQQISIQSITQNPDAIFVSLAIFSCLLQDLGDVRLQGKMTSDRRQRMLQFLIEGEARLQFDKMIEFVKIVLDGYVQTMRSTVTLQHPFVPSFVTFFPRNESQIVGMAPQQSIHLRLLRICTDILDASTKIISPITTTNNQLILLAITSAIPLIALVSEEDVYEWNKTLEEVNEQNMNESEGGEMNNNNEQDNRQLISDVDGVCCGVFELLCSIVSRSCITEYWGLFIQPFVSFITQHAHRLQSSYMNRSLHIIQEFFENQLFIQVEHAESVVYIANEVLPRITELASRFAG
ncbi:MAG: hypothetical protein EZS28_027639, partial [Streblomastix strix]